MSAFGANPFSDDYFRQELQFYAMPEGHFRFGAVNVRHIQPPCGQMDDYFNINSHAQLPLIPALFIKRQLWMSLTPLEVQSLALPIAMAEGRVATAGLGLGYFALRAAAKANVEEVLVYEQSPGVIAFFNTLFGQRPERSKITLIYGDVRELLRGRLLDFVFMDPYLALLPDRVIDDAHFFRRNNAIGHYRFWGMERVLLDALIADEHPLLLPLEAAFFEHWLNALRHSGRSGGGMLRDSYYPLTDRQFRARVMAALGREMGTSRVVRYSQAGQALG